jgi:hypothetical protein
MYLPDRRSVLKDIPRSHKNGPTHHQDRRLSYLGLIVQDVTVFDNRISVRIHTLPENPSELTGSKNRLAWLSEQDSNLG